MKITESEQIILNLLWEKERMSIQQIVDALAEETGWSRHAVISFLKKMENKGTVSYEEQGRTRYYFARVKRSEVVLKSTKNILDKFFGGSLGQLVTYMADADQLTQKDVEELNTLLDRMIEQKRAQNKE